jgi:LPS-assembly protein
VVTWRWPLVRNIAPYQVMIEPIVGAVVSPFGNNPEDIPDEDSRGFEIGSTNLFDGSRFPGYDRVEGGQRVNYGMNFAVYGDTGGFSSLFLGQSVRLRDDESLLTGSGVEDELSDVVGRIEIQPIADFSLVDRFRFDVERQKLTSHDLTFSAGPPALRLSAQYVFIEDGETSDSEDAREEVAATLSSRIDEYWRIYGHVRYDLNEGSTRVSAVGLTYEDECFLISSSFTRSFYEDRDLKPSDTVSFRIGLKTLGELTL